MNKEQLTENNDGRLKNTIMKHTARFQTLLRSHCPDCEQAQAWLDKYGNSL
jgi:predicted metal-dependent hydrolase